MKRELVGIDFKVWRKFTNFSVDTVVLRLGQFTGKKILPVIEAFLIIIKKVQWRKLSPPRTLTLPNGLLFSLMLLALMTRFGHRVYSLWPFSLPNDWLPLPPLISTNYPLFLHVATCQSLYSFLLLDFISRISLVTLSLLFSDYLQIIVSILQTLASQFLDYSVSGGLVFHSTSALGSRANILPARK